MYAHNDYYYLCKIILLRSPTSQNHTLIYRKGWRMLRLQLLFVSARTVFTTAASISHLSRKRCRPTLVSRAPRNSGAAKKRKGRGHWREWPRSHRTSALTGVFLFISLLSHTAEKLSTMNGLFDRVADKRSGGARLTKMMRLARRLPTHLASTERLLVVLGRRADHETGTSGASQARAGGKKRGSGIISRGPFLAMLQDESAAFICALVVSERELREAKLQKKRKKSRKSKHRKELKRREGRPISEHLGKTPGIDFQAHPEGTQISHTDSKVISEDLSSFTGSSECSDSLNCDGSHSSLSKYTSSSDDTIHDFEVHPHSFHVLEDDITIDDMSLSPLISRPLRSPTKSYHFSHGRSNVQPSGPQRIQQRSSSVPVTFNRHSFTLGPRQFRQNHDVKSMNAHHQSSLSEVSSKNSLHRSSSVPTKSRSNLLGSDPVPRHYTPFYGMKVKDARHQNSSLEVRPKITHHRSCSEPWTLDPYGYHSVSGNFTPNYGTGAGNQHNQRNWSQVNSKNTLWFNNPLDQQFSQGSPYSYYAVAENFPIQKTQRQHWHSDNTNYDQMHIRQSYYQTDQSNGVNCMLLQSIRSLFNCLLQKERTLLSSFHHEHNLKELHLHHHGAVKWMR